jgi:hypothetical protein
MLRRVALVKPNFSEESSASLIRVRRIGELGATLAVTSSRHAAKKYSLQEQHAIASQKTTLFIVTAVKTSNLT